MSLRDDFDLVMRWYECDAEEIVLQRRLVKADPSWIGWYRREAEMIMRYERCGWWNWREPNAARVDRLQTLKGA